MTDNESRIMALVEEILDSNCSPDEACREHPDLLPEVRERLQRFHSIEARVGEVFPPRKAPSDLSPSPPSRPARLPDIPGYELLEMVGAGGMGVVYKATQLRLNRTVAIKMLLSGEYAGSRELERFQRESEAVAALRHPNIVQVHDAGEHDRFAYFAMEFMEGGTLNRALAGAPQPARMAAQTTATLARAVHAAHLAGIVHRDLKPGNVLLASDGTLKIADFGLARRFDGAADPAMTLAGVRVGTPSYMSPEQATGRTSAVGPASDLYSLGAILYEVLTGRPPFRGESAAETERQVIHDDPVAPTRLNPRVPRDLETICLKCLQKDPARRYASAAALADDLNRFEEGRPIQARPVGWGERIWRWGRRNPAAAALLATALALVGFASGGGVWLLHQRAAGRAEAGRQDVEAREVIRAAVAQAERLGKVFQFREARAVLERASSPLEGGWRSLPPDAREGLRSQMKQAESNLVLAERLDTARNQAASIVEGRVHPTTAAPLYASAFSEAGLGRKGEPTEAMAAAVRASPIRVELVAALDDWASITPDAERRVWLLAVARGADPDPLKDRLRQPELWRDADQLVRVAEEADVAGVSPQLATALARVARTHHRSAVPMLMATQARFPQDFGVNYELGFALCREGKGVEGLGYFRAALAIRPAAVSHNGIGYAFVSLGRLDEASDHFQEAIRLDPEYAAAQYDLGDVLHRKGRLDQAVGQYRKALDIDPDLGAAHIGLGAVACAQGRIDDAFEEYQQALRIDPNDAMAHDGLGFVLRAKGELDEAILEGQEALRLDPNIADAHNNLGYTLYLKGRVDEAIEHYRHAISIDPKAALPHHNLGGALGRKGLIDEAIEEYRQALNLDPKLAPAHSNLATALRAKGRLDEAIPEYLEAIRLDPRDAAAHIMLAKNLRDRGQLDEAIDHIMQGGRIDPKLAVYEDKLGDDLYADACAKIQSVVNQEFQAKLPDEAERAALRRQALELLRADLRLTIEIVKDRKVAKRSLSAWQTDLALTSVREASELAELPDAEREQWQHLWADVATEIAADLKVPNASVK